MKDCELQAPSPDFAYLFHLYERFPQKSDAQTACGRILAASCQHATDKVEPSFCVCRTEFSTYERDALNRDWDQVRCKQRKVVHHTLRNVAVVLRDNVRLRLQKKAR